MRLEPAQRKCIVISRVLKYANIHCPNSAFHPATRPPVSACTTPYIKSLRYYSSHLHLQTCCETLLLSKLQESAVGPMELVKTHHTKKLRPPHGKCCFYNHWMFCIGDAGNVVYIQINMFL